MNIDRIVIIALALGTICVLVYVNQLPTKKLRWLNCEDTFDSVLVKKPQNRGAFEGVLDSLILSPSYHPFDTTICDTIPVTGLIWSPLNIICSISDIDVPFIVFKPTQSDTIHVIKNGQTIFFRVPCDMNEWE